MQVEVNKARNSAKWQLLLMVAMVAGVIIAGFIVFPKNAEQRDALLMRIGTTNHGELLQNPAAITELDLVDDQGMTWQPYEQQEQKAKWRLLLLGDEHCLDDCAEMLFVTRQVHLRLGKYAQRFQRVFLSTAKQLDDSLRKQFHDEHPYLKVVFVDRSALNAWLENVGIADPHGVALLVDPRGLAMMRYGVEQGGGEMLEDINHLMKYSAE